MINYEYQLTNGIPMMKMIGNTGTPFMIKPVMIHYMSRVYYILGLYPDESVDDMSPLLHTDLEAIYKTYLKYDIMPFIWECAGRPDPFKIPDDVLNSFAHDLGEWLSVNSKGEL